jgi:hypothetical protein
MGTGRDATCATSLRFNYRSRTLKPVDFARGTPVEISTVNTEFVKVYNYYGTELSLYRINALKIMSKYTERTGRISSIQWCTQLLKLWSRVLLQELIAAQLLKKFAVFYGNRRFLIVFTGVRYWTLSYVR